MIESTAIETTAAMSLERKQLLDAGELLGASRLAQRLVDTLGAQNMRALEVFQANKMYEVYGYATFAEFLDNSPSSPMTKNQYYERRKLLALEGDDEFDLLNSLNVPARHRKLLTAGDVVLDGDQLIVGEKSVPINDAKAVRKAIAKAVEQFERIETKAAKSEKENEKLKKQVEELKAEAENTSPPPPDLTDEIAQSFIALLSSFANIKNLLAHQTPGKAKGWIATNRRRVDLAVEDFALFCNGFVGEDDELTDEELARIMED